MAMTPKKSEKTTRKSASDTVFDELKNSIIERKWLPGEKIPSENQLCTIFGVSRVSVRAAINRLSGSGLLESRQGGGTFVCQNSGAEAINAMTSYVVLDNPDRINMFEFRKIMEVESVGLAAMRADISMVTAMRETIEGMRTTEDPAISASFDVEFHYLIAKATGNPIIIKIFELLKDAYYSLLKQNTAVMGGAHGVYYHEMMCRAIEIRDFETARFYMVEHLSDTIMNTDGANPGICVNCRKE